MQLLNERQEARSHDRGQRSLPAAHAHSLATRKIGSTLWIISEETSMNRLTKPSAQIRRGMAGRRSASFASGLE